MAFQLSFKKQYWAAQNFIPIQKHSKLVSFKKQTIDVEFKLALWQQKTALQTQNSLTCSGAQPHSLPHFKYLFHSIGWLIWGSYHQQYHSSFEMAPRYVITHTKNSTVHEHLLKLLSSFHVAAFAWRYGSFWGCFHKYRYNVKWYLTIFPKLKFFSCMVKILDLFALSRMSDGKRLLRDHLWRSWKIP